VGSDGELKEAARAKITQPLARDLHTVKMDELSMRVIVNEVLPEFHDMDPPKQPQGADKHMKLGECGSWVLEWPKTQIRLGNVLLGARRTGGATSRPQAPIVRPPSRRTKKDGADEPAPQAAVTNTQKEQTVAATAGHPHHQPPRTVVGNVYNATIQG